MIEYRLSAEQKQSLSQKTIQSIEILRMTAQQLESFLEGQLMENPVVDPDLSYSPDSLPLESPVFFEESDEPEVFRPHEEGRADQRMQSEALNLRQRIFLLALPRITSATEERVVRFLIDSLDEKGYLSCSIEEVSFHCGVSTALVEQCLQYLHDIVPYGIGARSLSECLEIQLRHLDSADADTAITLVREHLSDIADNRVRQMAKALGKKESEIFAAIRLIQTLNPKPLNGFCEGHTQYITPDITVEDTPEGFRVTISGGRIRNLAVAQNYAALVGQAPQEVCSYLQEYYHSAQWINHCIEQRRQTLTMIVEQLLILQRDFFRMGSAGLKSLTQSDLGKRLGLSDSTISRAIADKYLKCCWGTFPLKFFFPKPTVGTDADVSIAKAKQIILSVISGEDPAHPLSDQKLADLLAGKGITISRRTVAKYRTEMNIPDTSRRRTYV